MIAKVVFESKSDNVNNPVDTGVGEIVEKVAVTQMGEEVLSPPIAELVERYFQKIKERKGETTPIHVDEIASKVAILYEKVRKIVDWKEENVLRRSAILRILKRNLISKLSGLNPIINVKAQDIAEPLVLELIRGGHLPNDEIPEEKIKIVSAVLGKYIYLLENAPYKEVDDGFILKTKINFYNFILEIAACEIEDILSPPFKENDLIRAMTHLMKERIKIIPAEAMSEKDRETQIYIAVCRTLFDLDDSLISYHILKYQYSQWLTPLPENVADFTKNIFSIINYLEKELMHPQRNAFIGICERVDTVFTIFGDILENYKKDPEEILPAISQKEKFRTLISKFYDVRYKTLKRRLFRLAIVTSLSVFFSNFFTFFIVEVPLAHLFYEGFNPLATAVDFLIPPLVMFCFVAVIKPPGPKNLEDLIIISNKFIYNDQDKENFEIKLKKKRRPVANFIIASLYIIFALLFFYFVAWVFYIASLPITSVAFDTMQIALNIFAAVTIRNKAKELTVSDKSTFWEFIIDIFSVPAAKVGSFFARKWKEYNVFSVFLNFFVETPFVGFIEFIESWSRYLKEKKAEIH